MITTGYLFHSPIQKLPDFYTKVIILSSVWIQLDFELALFVGYKKQLFFATDSNIFQLKLKKI